jgi:hypothetical protein
MGVEGLGLHESRTDGVSHVPYVGHSALATARWLPTSATQFSYVSHQSTASSALACGALGMNEPATIEITPTAASRQRSFRFVFIRLLLQSWAKVDHPRSDRFGLRPTLDQHHVPDKPASR